MAGQIDDELAVEGVSVMFFETGGVISSMQCCGHVTNQRKTRTYGKAQSERSKAILRELHCPLLHIQYLHLWFDFKYTQGGGGGFTTGFSDAYMWLRMH